MVVDRNIGQYITRADESIRVALKRIDENKSRIIFTVTDSGTLEGVLTDGDFRRSVLKNPQLDLSQPASSISNKQFIYASIDAKTEDVEHYLSDKILFVPLLDDKHHLIAIARKGLSTVQIGKFTISDSPPAFIIAEIGLNHNGNVHLAKRMVRAAKDAGADCAKFQVRDLTDLYSNKGERDDASEDLGSQYVLDMLHRSHLTNKEYLEVFEECKAQDILPLCSAWDTKSITFLEENANLPAYKVASPDLTNHDLLTLLSTTGKPLLVSTGMSTEVEIKEAVSLLKNAGASYVLLQCNSTYPVPFKDVHLAYMDRLKKIGECPIGYSGHERGIAVSIAAVACGATVIEKHFTFDKTMEGNDHKVSLLPEEFATMVKSIREVEEAMGSDAERVPSQGELMNRSTLAKSLIINCDVSEGETILEHMIDVKSPGKGLQPNKKKELIGKNAKRNMKTGDFFYPSDIAHEVIQARPYKFKRPWGLPVRYHDYELLTRKSNPDFAEFHLSYKDLDADWAKFVTEKKDIGFTVHSPDVFPGDHLLNLAAESDEERKRSLHELQRVIDVTKSMKSRFTNTERPFVIASVGGYTKNGFIDSVTRDRWYDRIAEGISSLQSEGVEILPQTLPPFPWYFGGQLYLNLYVTPEDTAAFCKKYDMRLCLDISHSKLTCNYFHRSFKEFVDIVGPYIAHLHIVDAQGVDGEGVQIGEGEVDFPALAEQLEKCAPDASFIPEIWQGHKNDGEGFWVALESLECIF